MNGDLLPLPEVIVARGLALAKTCAFMGRPLESLTRDELLACAAISWDAHRQEQEWRRAHWEKTMYGCQP